MSRCNNSSPRICMRNHYALLAHLKISYVFDLQDKHNASYFYPNVMDRAFLSACKITQKHSLQQAIITYCSFLSTALSFNHKFHLSVLPWQDSSTSKKVLALNERAVLFIIFRYQIHGITNNDTRFPITGRYRNRTLHEHVKRNTRFQMYLLTRELLHAGF